MNIVGTDKRPIARNVFHLFQSFIITNFSILPRPDGGCVLVTKLGAEDVLAAATT